MSTFTWTPDEGATCEREPRVLAVAFGDGYEQRTADGINADMKTWQLSFSVRSNSEIVAIDAFLAAEAGVTAFDWTDPDGHAGKWVCKKWSRRAGVANVQSVTATFREVPA